MVGPRLPFSEFFEQSPYSSNIHVLEIRLKTQVSACSGSPSEAMLWIKEVDMVETVDDLKSSRSIVGNTHWPIFELLDHSKFLLQEGPPGGTECSEGRPFFSVEGRSRT